MGAEREKTGVVQPEHKTHQVQSEIPLPQRGEDIDPLPQPDGDVPDSTPVEADAQMQG
ncbi:MAG: hypothetical protein WAT77_16155 [Paracoccaceae bacterium]